MAFVNLMEVIYPVGSVYISTSSTSPSSLIGGSWTAISGACLAAIGSSGVTVNSGYCGKASLTVSQMPAHRHNVDSYQRGIAQRLTTAAGDGSTRWAFIASKQADLGWSDDETTGGGEAFLPYSYGFYVWRRVS